MREDKEMKCAVRAERLTVFFKSKSRMSHIAVNDISFSLEKGETLAVVGESGSGKTTLMRSVLGLVKRSSGKVFLFGTDIDTLKSADLAKVRRRCGYVPQDPYGALPPGLSALEAVVEPQIIAKTGMSKEEARVRAKALLAELGLEGERILNSRAVGLSGGQRQRVEIARSLMLDPDLLLCDEPTSMQDVSTRRDIIEILKKKVAHNAAMMFVTHDLVLAGRVADRIMVVKDGRLCEEGDSASLLSNPSHPYTAELINAVPRISPDIRQRLRR
jgi:ABC-type glutathione transport system ATPase component